MDELKEQAQMQGNQAAVLIPELLERIKTLEMANEPFVIETEEDEDGNTILKPELVEAFEAEVLTGKRNKLLYKSSNKLYSITFLSESTVYGGFFVPDETGSTIELLNDSPKWPINIYEL